MNYFEINYPGYKIMQRTEFSKAKIESKFKDIMDNENILDDFKNCILNKMNFFFVNGNKMFLDTKEINKNKLSYLFIPEFEGVGTLSPPINRIPLDQLDTVFIPKNINTLDCGLFRQSQISFMYIPPTVKCMGIGLFEQNHLLHTVICDSESTIPAQCFLNNLNLANITLNDNTRYIFEQAFFNCIRLKHIDLPEDLISIGKLAFAHTGLKEIKFNESLKLIKDNAFLDTKIEKLFIPKNIEKIHSLVFDQCPLTEITFEDITNLELQPEAFKTTNIKTGEKYKYKVYIKEPDKQKAAAWIEKYKYAFNENCIFKIANEETLDVIINKHKRLCGYIGGNNKEDKTEER